MFKKVIMTLSEKNFGVAQEARDQLGPNIQVITDKKNHIQLRTLELKILSWQNVASSTLSIVRTTRVPTLCASRNA